MTSALRRAGGGPRRDERGAALVLTAVFAMVAMAMLALVIDVGNAYQERRQAQSAADAASLAGAVDIVNGDASAASVRDMIKSYVQKNYGTVSWTGCTDANALAIKPDAPNQCISWDADPPATTKVRVAIPTRNVTTFFGKAATGIAALSVRASATAAVTASPSNVCALCSLTPTAPNTNLQNGIVKVTDGAVGIGGPLACSGGSLTTFGTPQPAIRINANGTPSCTSSFSPTPNWNGGPIADPLRHLPAKPDYSGLTAKANCTSGTATPGVYNTIGGSCHLSPGLYVVTGTVGGSSGSAVTGAGVTIFLACGTTSAVRACNAGEIGGALSTSGNASVIVSAATCSANPCTGGAYPNMAVWADRNNAAVMKSNGNGTVSLVGTMYMPGASLDIKGTPSGVAGTCQTHVFCSRIIVKSFAFSGQGTLDVAYVASVNVPPLGKTQLLA